MVNNTTPSERYFSLLKAHVEELAKIESYRGAALVLRHGREWTPTDIDPFDFGRGDPKQCYANAGDLAVLEADRERGGSPARVFYCEGYAIADASQPTRAVEHAWLGMPGGDAIEVTWERPGTAYFGIALQGEAIREWSTRDGEWGPFIATHDPFDLDARQHLVGERLPLQG